MLSPSAVAQLRRSVAMLSPRCREGLARETALEVLGQLEQLQSAHRRCPRCGHDLASPVEGGPLPSD